ncbi:hypothetical protein BKA69DRAFT_597441 [Paraphysoderma sedebokerense]|nr:hypothetical protein BKA69DRAFT_597441 [Paraphysoderma sedebokerense]
MDDDFDPTLARLQRTLASANSLFQRALQRAENLSNQPDPSSQDKSNTSPQKQKVWETSIQNLRRKLKTKNIGAVSEQSLLIDDVENRPLDANLISSQVMGGSESSLGLSGSSVSEDNRSEKSEIKSQSVLKATDGQILVSKKKSKRKPMPTKKKSLGKENMSVNNDNNPVVTKESDQPRPPPTSSIAGQQVKSAETPKAAPKDAVNSGGPPAFETLNFADTLVSKVVHDQEIVENHLSTLEQLHKRLHTMNEAFVSKQKDLLDVQSESVKQQAFKHIHFLQELNEKHIDWQVS